MRATALAEVAAAARWVVDEGMEYAQAKRRAARDLGQASARRGALPSDEQLEGEVRAYIELFCADTQPHELRALRELALPWLARLEAFRPHLSGAVWRGTATRWSSLHIDLYCDDPKAAEIALLNQGLDFDTATLDTAHGEGRSVFSLSLPCAALHDSVTVYLVVRDLDDQRGALKADAQGRSWRGDAKALRRLLEDPTQ